MGTKRTFFGMTSTQIAILAGLAVVACLLLGISGWLVFENLPQLFVSQSSMETPVPQFTPTLFLTSTPPPTETLTPLPYELLIPDGWEQHRTTLVEIWLPPGFKNAKSDEIAQFKTTAAVPELVLTSLSSKLDLYKVVVGITYEPLTTNTLDEFLNLTLSTLSSNLTLTDRRKVSINSHKVVRLILETRQGSLDLNFLVYVFLDGGTIWNVYYGAQINEFYEMLPTFETSIQTFRIVR